MRRENVFDILISIVFSRISLLFAFSRFFVKKVQKHISCTLIFLYHYISYERKSKKLKCMRLLFTASTSSKFYLCHFSFRGILSLRRVSFNRRLVHLRFSIIIIVLLKTAGDNCIASLPRNNYHDAQSVSRSRHIQVLTMIM